MESVSSLSRGNQEFARGVFLGCWREGLRLELRFAGEERDGVKRGDSNGLSGEFAFGCVQGVRARLWENRIVNHRSQIVHKIPRN